MTSLPRRWLAIALLPVGLLILSACTPLVPLEAAPDATNPECAEVIVRLPTTIEDTLGVHVKRETDAQATGAWGNPATILLRCGIPVPGPSTEPCYTIKGIDWLRDDSRAPSYVFTTYGRNPAIEVIVDGDKASGTNALEALSIAIGMIKPTRACTSPDDVLGIPSPSPSPSP